MITLSQPVVLTGGTAPQEAVVVATASAAANPGQKLAGRAEACTVCSTFTGGLLKRHGASIERACERLEEIAVQRARADRLEARGGRGIAATDRRRGSSCDALRGGAFIFAINLEGGLRHW